MSDIKHTDDYYNSFAVADGILTDAFCGIICTTLPMLKPICATYRDRDSKVWHTEVLNSLYAAYESKDVIDFLDMIKNKNDPMLGLRHEAAEKCLKHFDGQNGYRTKEFIKENI